MKDLFTIEHNLRISKITSEDVKLVSDKVMLLEEILREHEAMYPDIKKWFKNKVIPGIRSDERVAYIGFDGDKPIATSIVKRGKDSKFCHLHINEDFRNHSIGDVFFSLMTLNVKRFASDVHFTLPESLWEQKKDFFKSFGFEGVKKASTQYRLFEEELECSASFNDVWKSTLQKLPKIISSISETDNDILNGLLFSIKPFFIEQILNGSKKVEIRKRFNKKWIGSMVTLYSTTPTKALMGYAKIKDVKSDKPEKIWMDFNKEMGCTKEEYLSYVGTDDEVNAIIFDDVQPYYNNIPLSQLSYLLEKNLRPPQSYQSIKSNEHWAEAVSIAELLHGRFHFTTQL